MRNHYLPKQVKVLEAVKDSYDTRLFTLRYLEPKLQKKFTFEHGQFMMFGIPEVGEAPFDICSASTNNPRFFQLNIRMVGKVTRKLNELKKGDQAWVRGPFGQGFPKRKLNNRNLLLIGGGCGTVTLRSLILDHLDNRLNKENLLQLFYGCLNEATLQFKKEYKTWQKKVDLNVILEKPQKTWKGEKGLITKLFNTQKIVEKPVAVICGPPVMYKFVIKELKKKNVPDEDIYIFLERRMSCGIGVCQHCAQGSRYVCHDGPVFSLKDLSDQTMLDAY